MEFVNYNIDILNLRCPICLNIFKEPYILPCQAKCIACFKCIKQMFKCTPKQFNQSDELHVIAKCLCNEDNIFIDKTVPCFSVRRIVKHITIKCKNSPNGCPFFIGDEMEKVFCMHTKWYMGKLFNIRLKDTLLSYKV